MTMPSPWPPPIPDEPDPGPAPITMSEEEIVNHAKLIAELAFPRQRAAAALLVSAAVALHQADTFSLLRAVQIGPAAVDQLRTRPSVEGDGSLARIATAVLIAPEWLAHHRKEQAVVLARSLMMTSSN